MDYYQLLKLEREPFSNAPDPEYFFQSQQHRACLQKLELALRLKRGLNVILGDVGTGKTTLCRELIRKFALEKGFETHLVLDPAVEAPRQFLQMIAGMLCPAPAEGHLSESEIKEKIKQTLFAKGVDQGKTVILIIDEAQKIAPASVELLRELLNYETNAHKLLQIVLFAQQEFADTLEQHPNFADRINLLHRLSPMSYGDTCRMIRHRLKLASNTPKPLNLFTRPALWAVYLASRGYPRRIIHLCHQSMLAIIIQNKSRAGWATIRSCENRISPVRRRSQSWPWVLAVAAGGVIAAVILLTPHAIHKNGEQQLTQVFKIIQDPDKIAPAPKEESLQATLPAALATFDALPPALKPEQPPPFEPGRSSGNPPAGDPVTGALATATPLAEEAAISDLAEPLPPQNLGRLRVRPGDTIGDMVYRVYGAYRNRILDAVLESNPHIPEPNKIEPGDEINFPALPFPTQHGSAENHWIILNEDKELASAHHAMRLLDQSLQLPLSLISWWSGSNGLMFRVAVKGTFSNQEAAEQFLATLPPEASAQAVIVSQWEDDAKFYSNPYAGVRR